MREGGRVVRQALALGALSVLVAAAVHFPLLQRFVRGEFRDSFLAAKDYPAVRLITLEEGEELWRAGGTVFVDARKEGEYREGHIPNALNAPTAEAEKALPQFVKDLPREGVLAVYCEGGDCQSSLLLAKRLSEAGFKDIRVMTGGWAEWSKAGLPVEKAEKEVRREKGDGQE